MQATTWRQGVATTAQEGTGDRQQLGVRPTGRAVRLTVDAASATNGQEGGNQKKIEPSDKVRIARFQGICYGPS